MLAAHDEALQLGKCTTFNIVYELQQWLSAYVYAQRMPPSVTWDKEYKKVSINGKTLDLAKVTPGIDSLIKEFWTKYHDLVGPNLRADLLPSGGFADDMTNNKRGHSFLSTGTFSSKPDAILVHIMKEGQIAVTSREGTSINKLQARQALNKSGEIIMILCILLYIIPRISTRLTQFLDMQLSNGDRLRNVMMLYKEMILLSQYDKTTNITSRDICEVSFVPPVLREMVLEVFAGGLRDAEVHLATAAYGPEVGALYRRSVSYDILAAGLR